MVQVESIDISSETIIGSFDIPKHFPGPRKPARSTVFRWMTEGQRVLDTQERVRLTSEGSCRRKSFRPRR